MASVRSAQNVVNDPDNPFKPNALGVDSTQALDPTMTMTESGEKRFSFLSDRATCERILADDFVLASARGVLVFATRLELGSFRR